MAGRRSSDVGQLHGSAPATKDYDPKNRRLLYRTTIKGFIPF